MITRKEMELLERVADHITSEELNHLLDPFNERETKAFLYKLGKALGIDTKPAPHTAPIYFYDPSNLDRDTEESQTVLVQVWIHHPTTGRNTPHTVEARSRGRLVKAFKSGKLDPDTFGTLLSRLR